MTDGEETPPRRGPPEGHEADAADGAAEPDSTRVTDGNAAAPDTAPAASRTGTGRRWRSPAEPCLNCGDPTPGRFCAACGQRKTIVQVSVPVIVSDVVADEMGLNSALPRTLLGILFRPGHLTNEYVRGRVVRYIPPLRLYLLSSILFFLTLSFVGLRALDRANLVIGDAELADAEPAGAESVTAILRGSQAELAALDTMAMAATDRAVVRRSLRETQASLRALGDTAAVVPASRRPAQDGLALPRGTLQPWAEEVHDNVEGGPLERPVRRKLAQLGHLPPRDATRAFLRELLEYSPHMMFVLLPVFALFLKALYVRRGRYYAEHFVFALHVHAFFFLMFFIMLALPWSGANWLMVLWMLAYVWVALKRVYGQGWFRTTVKWWVLGWTYFILITFGLLGLVFSTLLMS
jgi:hypothetical protein